MGCPVALLFQALWKPSRGSKSACSRWRKKSKLSLRNLVECILLLTEHNSKWSKDLTSDPLLQAGERERERERARERERERESERERQRDG